MPSTLELAMLSTLELAMLSTLELAMLHLPMAAHTHTHAMTTAIVGSSISSMCPVRQM